MDHQVDQEKDNSNSHRLKDSKKETLVYSTVLANDNLNELILSQQVLNIFTMSCPSEYEIAAQEGTFVCVFIRQTD